MQHDNNSVKQYKFCIFTSVKSCAMSSWRLGTTADRIKKHFSVVLLLNEIV